VVSGQKLLSSSWFFFGLLPLLSYAGRGGRVVLGEEKLLKEPRLEETTTFMSLAEPAEK
jgi:hypothetical protein|tara:strand:- start:368 stop:544 length:177 start_codon:yes stop_codon:yes gene_type:complete